MSRTRCNLLLAVMCFELILLIGGTACAPTKKIYLKEVVRVITNPTRGTRSDTFLKDTPFGNVNFQFVVDNTDVFSHSINDFKMAYSRFLTRFNPRNSEIKHLNTRIQLTATPSSTSSDHAFASPGSANLMDAHLLEAFGNGSDISGYMTQIERGELPKPFQSAEAGLKSRAFIDRAHTPFFIVFFLGQDSNPNEVLKIDELMELVGKHQLHIYLVHNRHNLPTCRNQHFYPASRVAFQLELAQRSVGGSADFIHEVDLCTSNWDQLLGEIFDSMVAFKRKYVLSKIPFLPEGIKVTINGNLLQQGLEFTYHADTNEIKFADHYFIPDHSPIEVQYFLEPPLSSNLNDLAPPF